MRPIRRLSLVLFTIGIVLYIPSWFNGFVWDDEEQIVNNPFIKRLAYIPHQFSGSTFGGGGSSLPTGGYYKPLMSVWYTLNYAIWGNWAGGFHLMQSVLHAVNAVMMFWVIYKLLSQLDSETVRQLDKQLERKTNRPTVQSSTWLFTSFIVSLWWLVHPGNVESVAYAASVQEVLSTFFGLSAILINTLRERVHLDEITALFVSTILLLLSLLSKESGLVFWVVITAYLCIIKNSWQSVKFFWLLSIPVFTSYAILRFGLAKIFILPHPVIPVAQLTFPQRWLTMIETVFNHVRITFFPWQLYIGHHQVFTGWSVALAVKLLVIIAVATIMLWLTIRSRKRSSWFFLVWLTTAVGVTSNLVPLDMTYAERWSYMPILAFAGWIAGMSGSAGRRVGLSALIVCSIFSVRTMGRQLDWHDGLRLYGRDLTYAHHAFDIENNYGVELFRTNRMDEARIHFERSIALAPTWWTNYSNLGVIMQRHGNTDEAKKLYQQSIDNGHYFLAYENLATLLIQEQDPRAAEVIRHGLERYPNNETLQQLAIYRR